jgi:hypothetical protein
MRDVFLVSSIITTGFVHPGPSRGPGRDVEAA